MNFFFITKISDLWHKFLTARDIYLYFPHHGWHQVNFISLTKKKMMKFQWTSRIIFISIHVDNNIVATQNWNFSSGFTVSIFDITLAPQYLMFLCYALENIFFNAFFFSHKFITFFSLRIFVNTMKNDNKWKQKEGIWQKVSFLFFFFRV